MKREKGGAMNETMNLHKKMVKQGAMTEQDARSQHGISITFIKESKYSLNPVLLSEEELRSFENGDIYKAIRKDQEAAYRAIEGEISSYALKYEDCPEWLPRGKSKNDLVTDTLAIHYKMYPMLFLCDYVISDQLRHYYGLTFFDVLIISKIMIMKDEVVSKSASKDIAYCMTLKFNREAVGGMVRHVSPAIAVKNMKEVLNKVLNKPIFPIIGEVIVRESEWYDDPITYDPIIKQESEMCHNECCKQRDEAAMMKGISEEDVEDFDDCEVEIKSVEVKKTFVDAEVVKQRRVPSFKIKFVEEKGQCFPIFVIGSSYYNNRALIVLARVSKSWYSALRRYSFIGGYGGHRHYQEIIKVPNRYRFGFVHTKMLRKGYSYNIDKVETILYYVISALGNLGDIVRMVLSYWDGKYDATCAFLVMAFVVMEGACPTKFYGDSILVLHRLYQAIPKSIVRRVISKFKYKEVESSLCGKVKGMKVYPYTVQISSLQTHLDFKFLDQSWTPGTSFNSQSEGSEDEG